MAAIGTITERERAVREEAYRDAVTNLRLEGLEMDEEAKRIFQRTSMVRSLPRNFVLRSTI